MDRYLFILLLLLSSVTSIAQVNAHQPSEFLEEPDGTVGLSEQESQLWVNAHLDEVMHKHSFKGANGLELAYRLFIPSDYDASRSYPLVVHLHGRGDRGTDNGPHLYNKLPLFNGPHSLVGPNFQARHPCIVLVPQCSGKTTNEEWAKWVGNTPETPFKGLGKDGSYEMNSEPSESGAATLQLIDHIRTNYSIDKRRTYLTGISMGGFGTWEYLSRRPELFAAAIPMAGFSDPHQIDQFKHIPIWIFHGGADQANPVEGSRNMYRLLRAAGANVNYNEYEGAAHSEAFQLAWSEVGLLDWLFSFKQSN